VRTAQVENRDDIFRRSLSETTDFWGNRFGDWIGAVPDQWGWGKAHAAVFEHPLGSVRPLDLLFNRGPYRLAGSADTVDVGGHNSRNMKVKSVASYRQIIDVGDWDNSLWQQTSGQSGQPLSKHYDDQIERWRYVQPFPMPYDAALVRAHEKGVLVLAP
jgi:penicillin amidase